MRASFSSNGDVDYKIRKLHKMLSLLEIPKQQIEDVIFKALKLTDEDAMYYLRNVLTQSSQQEKYYQAFLQTQKDGLSVRQTMNALSISQKKYYSDFLHIEDLSKGFFQFHYYQPDISHIEEVLRVAKSYDIL